MKAERFKIFSVVSNESEIFDRTYQGADGLAWRMTSFSDKEIDYFSLPVSYIAIQEHNGKATYFDRAFLEHITERVSDNNSLRGILTQLALAESIGTKQRSPVRVVLGCEDWSIIHDNPNFVEWVRWLLNENLHINLTFKWMNDSITGNLSYQQVLDNSYQVENFCNVLAEQLPKEFTKRISTTFDVPMYLHAQQKFDIKIPEGQFERLLAHRNPWLKSLILDKGCILNDTTLQEILSAVRKELGDTHLIISSSDVGLQHNIHFEDLAKKIWATDKELLSKSIKYTQP